MPHEENDDTIGDAWCFIGIERHTKLVLAFELGKRNEQATDRFMEKLVAPTFEEPFQLSTDGFPCYKNAVYSAFGERVDYAQLIKSYAQTEEPQRRYSPAKIVTVETKPISGNPQDERICTSHIERQNGSLRQWCKRLTRLTYAFSKRMENLRAALALHFAFYNFCRVHRSIRQTPAMASGLASRPWTMAELLTA